MDPRAVAAIRAFLETLADQDAVCALEYRGKTFRFRDVGQVQRSVKRLGQDNLHEGPKHLSGEFQGVLPKRRSFEFKVADSGEVITGKIGPGLQDPSLLNAHLNQHTSIDVMETRVGTGRPRYVLNQLPKWRGE